MADNSTRQITVQTPKSIATMLDTPAFQERIAKSLPKHLTPERFVRVAILATQRTPKLLTCTPESLIECLYRLSAMGLEPNGRDAHLIPFDQGYGDRKKTVCTLIVDYKGMVQLVRRTGEVKNFHADIVCENDDFSYSYGSDYHLRHKPLLANRGAVIAAYSFVALTNGGVDFEVMGLEEILKVRDRSQGYQTAVRYAKQDNKPINSPWENDFNPMAAKTAIRKHSKTLPLSPDLREAIETQDAEPFIDISGDPASALQPRRATFGDNASLPGDDAKPPVQELEQGGSGGDELDLTGEGQQSQAEPVAAAKTEPAKVPLKKAAPPAAAPKKEPDPF